MIKHKEDCLSINGKQSVKIEKGIIEFENYFKQIPVPFQLYADFECNLERVESYEGSHTKNIKITMIVDRLTKRFLIYRGENAAYEFIKAILRGYKYCKKE